MDTFMHYICTLSIVILPKSLENPWTHLLIDLPYPTVSLEYPWTHTPNWLFGLSYPLSSFEYEATLRRSSTM